MSIPRPARPATSLYPESSPYEAELDTAYESMQRELATSAPGWQDQGEKNDVRLWKKVDAKNTSAVPIVKGECVIEGATTDAILGGVVQLPGMRKLWDARFVDGFQVARYSRTSFQFYSEMKGFGWLVSPRDIAGVQRAHSENVHNGERTIIQTSVGSAQVPEQKGKTRATLYLSGWKLVPEGDNVRITYIVNVSLNGSIPSTVIAKLSTEAPLCTGRVRDVYYEYGYAPFVRLSDPSKEPSLVFQLETFSDPPASLAIEEHTREYRCSVSTTDRTEVGESFEIEYDIKRMYKTGIKVQVAGRGVEAVDDGKGRVKVTVTEQGQDATVVITPK